MNKEQVPEKIGFKDNYTSIFTIQNAGNQGCCLYRAGLLLGGCSF